jgi:hypothetical protein
MSGNHTSTSNHHKEVLIEDLKLTQYKNSSIFENKGFFVLSPSVQNTKMWFDLRKVNLDRQPTNKNGLIIIRLFDDFILIDLEKFNSEMIDRDPFNTTNSGIHWKYQIQSDTSNHMFILNMKNKKKFKVSKIDKSTLLSNLL